MVEDTRAAAALLRIDGDSLIPHRKRSGSVGCSGFGKLTTTVSMSKGGGQDPGAMACFRFDVRLKADATYEKTAALKGPPSEDSPPEG